MKTVIRPDLKKFLIAQQGNVLFLIVFLALAIYMDLPRLWLFYWLLFALLGAMFLISFITFRKRHIEITDQYLTGWIPRQTLYIHFSDVKIAKEVQSQGRKYFFIQTEKDSIYLPLDLFNSDELQLHLREKIHTLAFEDQTYINFQNTIKKRLLGDTILADTNEFSTWPLWMGVIIGLIFLGMRIWVSKANDLFYLSGCFFIPSLIYLFICYAHFKADASSIKVFTRTGQFEFLWDDLETVQISQTGNTLILRGKNKQLIVDLSLAGKNRGDLIRKILVHIEDKNITPFNKPIYLPVFNKNTRLPKGESV